MNHPHHPAPPDLVKRRRCGIPAHPNKQGLTNNMIFGYKAPKTRIFGVMAVIAHHPVIVEFKGIAVGWFSINADVIAVYL